MGDPSARAAVEDGIIFGESFGEIVGIKQCDFGTAGKASSANHGEVHPRDDENTGTSVRGRGDWTDAAS